MKTLFTLSVILIFVHHTLYSQTRKHEVSIGYGIGTSNEIVGAFSDLLLAGVSGGNYETNNEGYTGAFQVSYKYLIQDKIGLGGTLTYEHGTADVRLNGEPYRSAKKDYYTIAVEADYRYIHKPQFSLYSGLGLGPTFHYEKYTPQTGVATTENTIDFNFQITGIGARLGRRLGGFAEVGFGYKGLVCVGGFARF